MEKKLIILICYDISGFFDKELLSDAVDELYSINVDFKVCRLFFKLNEDTRVRVRTGCGYSDWGEVGDILGKGSGGAAKVQEDRPCVWREQQDGQIRRNQGASLKLSR